MENTYDLIIIGGCPAGITAGIYGARKTLKTLLITKDFVGQIGKTGSVENYPGFADISGSDLIFAFQKHLEKYRNQEGLKLLVHSRNRVEPVVMLTLNDFAGLLESYLVLKCQKPKTNEKNTDPSLTPL